MPDRAALRRRIARTLDERSEAIVRRTVAVFPFSGPRTLDTNGCARLCEAALRMVGRAVMGGGLDAGDGVITDVRRPAQDLGVGPQQLFGVVYLIERAALDELALEEQTHGEHEDWPSIEEIIRRASCEALGAFAERLTHDSAAGSLVDPLTTLHARAVFEVVLDKEIQRAERFRHPFALIVFDVDRLGDINAAHGSGFGDRVLERIGIVMRNYFREHDWVARWAEDSFVVLLPETQPEYARLLAERVRVTVEDRMALRDYRTEERVAVTVSVAVVLAESVDADIKVADLMRLADQALYRAKQAGRNRVERVDVSALPGTAPSASPPRTGPQA